MEKLAKDLVEQRKEHHLDKNTAQCLQDAVSLKKITHILLSTSHV